MSTYNADQLVMDQVKMKLLNIYLSSYNVYLRLDDDKQNNQYYTDLKLKPICLMQNKSRY